jgi:hypothetical protein
VAAGWAAGNTAALAAVARSKQLKNKDFIY